MLELAMAVWMGAASAGGGCCAGKKAVECPEMEGETSVVTEAECQEKSKSCCDKMKAKTGCCPYGSTAPSGHRMFIGVRGGALFAENGPDTEANDADERASSSFGASIRFTLSRRISLGAAADVSRLPGRATLISIGPVARVRLLGHCLQLFAEGGPTVRRTTAPAVDGRGSWVTTSAGFTSALGLSVYSGFGMRFEAAYLMDGPIGGCRTQPCGSLAPGARLALTRAF